MRNRSIRHALLSACLAHIWRAQQQSAHLQHLEAPCTCTAQSAAPTLGARLVKGLPKPHCGHPSPAGARRALRRSRA
eukprot:COSAG01_NODE_2942_length_6815_cov_103.694312_9_plen_77_part_00